MRARAVISGAAVLSAFGPGKEPFQRALLEGRTAFAQRVFDDEGRWSMRPPLFAAYLAGFLPTDYLKRKGLRDISRDAQIFMSAAVMACRDARLDLAACDNRMLGVCVGTYSAGVHDYCRLVRDTEIDGVDRFDFMLAPQTGFNAPASQLSILLHAHGPNLTMSTGTAAGIDAVAYAADVIRNGQAEVVFAGGVDLLSFTIAALTSQAGNGTHACHPRPFDRDRAGSVPGEAACVFVVEAASHAEQRGACVLAEIEGSGAAFSAARPPAEAAVQAMQGALSDAGRDPHDVAAVFASACGDGTGDGAEATAIHRVFGDATLVSGVKGATGECQAASGALQIASALSSVGDGVVPPTVGFATPDPALPALLITTRPVACEGRRVLIHSLDPAGHASAIVLSTGREDRHA